MAAEEGGVQVKFECWVELGAWSWFTEVWGLVAWRGMLSQLDTDTKICPNLIIHSASLESSR